jgi:uncharacterized phage protein gp47/JayE
MTILTIAQIRDQILTDIQSGLGLTSPPLPRSAFGILATAVAGALSLVYRFATWVQRQIFTATADRASLVLRGTEYGLTPTAAQPWQGTATTAGTDGTVLPAGTLYQKDGTAYRTRAQFTLFGTTTITLESLDAGDALNLDTSDEIRLVTPITGVDRTATVASTTQTGEDAETDEAFRARILQRQRNQPQGGAIPDWIGWATAVPGIAEAKIDRPAAGTITVYPLTDDPDPANRIPSGAKLTEVEDYISDPIRSPIRAGSISVTAPTEVVFDVDISDLSPNTAPAKTAIEDAIEAHLYSRRPKQYSDEPDPIDTISAARLSAIAVSAGAEVATVDLKNAGGSGITDYELDIHELAKLRDLTWV